MKTDEIDILGLSKAKVLAALYNASRPMGLGWLHFEDQEMTEDEAAAILDIGDDHRQRFGGQLQKWGRDRLYFDYLKGRVLKVDLSGDTLYTGLYDRDNGVGAAARAIESIRETS